MEALKAFVRTRGAEFLDDRNVSSVGIGYKTRNGHPTNELAIQFTVREKAVPEALGRLGTVRIPASFNVGGVEVPSDVIQRDFTPDFRVVAEATGSSRKTRLDPMVPGISVANARETAGTIGCIVFDQTDGTPYVLSNWHVLHGPNGAIGDEIVQPGPFDDNRTNLNRLGILARSHLGHAGDCAVATIDSRAFDPAILDLDVKVEKLGEPELGDAVVKSGRTTGVTRGIVTRIHTISKIDYGGTVGEREVGGFEIGIDPRHQPDNGEVSMGGDSGSVWLFTSKTGKPTTVMAGLHFAGEGPADPSEHAVACYPRSVFEKLQISLTPPRTLPPFGTGFLPDFLSHRLELPTLSASNKDRAVKLDGSEVIPYTHFSLAMNKVRRFAFWVAWNIDGGRLRRISRKGIPFVIDPRIPEESQAGEALYSGNRLDRGHIARRADLLWGGAAEAGKANADSFFFTNIAPQMDDFNQSGLGGVWGQLEDAVFADTEVEHLKVSVFGGPVFHDDDREFRGVQIPREFWKVIVFVEGGLLKAKGFLMTQGLDELEALGLNQFKVFQVALFEIESRCGIRLPDVLKTADGIGLRLAGRPETLRERRALRSPEDIDWS
ncbi:MAG: DNA/RNA non-specific endonuclease [Luteitalea sp.]|nr:DNA/RNA non-specific endonuclease [Luteitalea sp.]